MKSADNGLEGKLYAAWYIPCDDAVCLNCRFHERSLQSPCKKLDSRPNEVIYQSAPCPAYAPDGKGITYLHDPEVKELYKHSLLAYVCYTGSSPVK